MGGGWSEYFTCLLSSSDTHNDEETCISRKKNYLKSLKTISFVVVWIVTNLYDEYIDISFVFIFVL